MGEPAHHLRDRIEAEFVLIGAARAEGGEVNEDDVLLHARQPLIIEPERSHGFRRQIGDDDVGGGEQPVEHLPALFRAQVQRQPLLVPPARHEADTAMKALREGQRPTIVPAPRRLDPDHLGTEIA